MSLFQKFSKALASESGELKKIRMQSEKRRSAKSSGELPKVDVIDKAIGALSNRIHKTEKSDGSESPEKPG
jgi:hypothetical protein